MKFLKTNWLFIVIALILIGWLAMNINSWKEQKTEQTVQNALFHDKLQSAIDSTKNVEAIKLVHALDSSATGWRKKLAKSEASHTVIENNTIHAANEYNADSTAQNKKCDNYISALKVELNTCKNEKTYLSKADSDCIKENKTLLEVHKRDSTGMVRKDSTYAVLNKATKRTLVEKHGIAIGGIGAALIVEAINIFANN